MLRDQIRERLRADEGTGPMQNGRHLPYLDCCGKVRSECKCKTKGFLTIGFGHLLDGKGITRAQADRLLDDDIDDTVREVAAAIPWVADIDPVRQAIVVLMAYQMGTGSAVIGTGLMGFRGMLRALKAGDYETAAVEMLDSTWARDDSPKRALRMANTMRTGTWQ